jgi:2-hydroxychromene-2-carboxylate isomerase
VKTIDFWFSIGSTYTYLSVSRISKVKDDHQVSFVWNPFSVRKLMMEMNNIPFTPPEKKVKSDYMWRDISRRAKNYNLSPKIPAPYPLKNFDLANQIAVHGVNEGWCEQYVKLTYKYWFENGIEAGSEECIDKVSKDMNFNPNDLIKNSSSNTIIEKYNAQTDKARELGIFGSPSFISNGEIFWGDDRLEDAINW